MDNRDKSEQYWEPDSILSWSIKSRDWKDVWKDGLNLNNDKKNCICFKSVWIEKSDNIMEPSSIVRENDSTWNDDAEKITPQTVNKSIESQKKRKTNEDDGNSAHLSFKRQRFEPKREQSLY